MFNHLKIELLAICGSHFDSCPCFALVPFVESGEMVNTGRHLDLLFQVPTSPFMFLTFIKKLH